MKQKAQHPDMQITVKSSNQPVFTVSECNQLRFPGRAVFIPAQKRQRLSKTDKQHRMDMFSITSSPDYPTTEPTRPICAPNSLSTAADARCTIAANSCRAHQSIAINSICIPTLVRRAKGDRGKSDRQFVYRRRYMKILAQSHPQTVQTHGGGPSAVSAWI